MRWSETDNEDFYVFGIYYLVTVHSFADIE
jgi:hypothetical protein